MYHSESAARGPESSESEWADDESAVSPASGPAPLPDADALESWTGLGDTSLGKLAGSRVVGLGLIKKVVLEAGGPWVLALAVDDSDTKRVIDGDVVLGGRDGILVGVTVGLGVAGADAEGGRGVPATGREMVKPSSAPVRSTMAPPGEEKGEDGELPCRGVMTTGLGEATTGLYCRRC